MKMKNFRSSFIGFILGVLIAIPVTALGASNAKVEALLSPNIKVVIDSKRIQLENTPILVEGRTYLPLRELGEKVMGMDVDWDQETSTAILTSKKENTLQNTDLTEDQLKNQETLRRAMADRRSDYFSYDSNLDVEDIKVLILRIESEIKLEKRFLADAEKANDPERFPPHLIEVVEEGLEQLKEARDYWQTRLENLEAKQSETDE